MLTEICAEIRNYFVEEIRQGTYRIVNGNIEPLDFLKDGQYFRIVGSSLNDGVYQYPDYALPNDEEFDGSIWAMAVPPSFIALAESIKEYVESDEAKPSAYQNESFGGYSYTKATDKNGVPLDWKKVFANKLTSYRRMSVL